MITTAAMNDSEDRILLFGNSRFDRDTGQLLDASGTRITISPKAKAVLTALIEQSGQAVDKDALAATAGVLTDEDLVETVAEIRRAMGDMGQTVIQTVPGVGYRLNALPQTVTPRKGNTLRYIGLAVAVLPVIAIIAFVLFGVLSG